MNVNKTLLSVSACLIAWFTAEAIGSFFWMTEIPLWSLLFTALFIGLARFQYLNIRGRLAGLREETREKIWIGAVIFVLVGGILMNLIVQLPTLAIDPPLSQNQTFSDAELDLIVRYWIWSLVVGVILTPVTMIRLRARATSKTKNPRKDTTIHFVVHNLN